VGYVALYFVGKEIGERLFPGETPLDTAFVDTELAESTAAYADERLAALRDALRRFRATDPRARKFQRVAELMAAIARDVRSDPKDAPAARAFLAYYADASVRLANLVADMDERGASAEQLADANARLGTALDRLVAAFEHHLARLQDDNLAELQAELDVLEQSMGFDDGSIFASLESLGEHGEKGKPATGAK
jgi:5-bromo-4-chloroindolyl phosphate hydrolysis protein